MIARVDSITAIDDTVICIVGVGYVGESLLKEFGRVFNTIGFDVSQSRIDHLKNIYGEWKNVNLTTNKSELNRATHYLISVPTLLKSDFTVDLSHIENALRMVLDHARAGCTIVIESSVAVGTTRRLLGPVQDYLHCGMSPERVDPGRTFPKAHEIPKIISGLDSSALEEIKTIYGKAFDTVVPVSKPEVAEMVKLYENCYRMINIAYVNEISDACKSYGIDADEMIDAASTKPYGFQAFRPSLGVGGHCIPVNPFYLLENNDLPLLYQATLRTHARPQLTAQKIHNEWLSSSKLNGITKYPRVLVVGVGFKPGQSETSYSPGLSFGREFLTLGCEFVKYYDPLVTKEIDNMESIDASMWNHKTLQEQFDIIAVCTKQHQVEFSVLDNVPSQLVHWL